MCHLHGIPNKMNGITTITFSVFAFAFIAVAHGHPISRMRSNIHPMQNIHRDLSCSCSCEDLGALVTLVRALEEKECCTATPASNGGISNADDLIMNLVNALITLTTQALSRSNCHCPNPSGTNNNPNPGHNGGSGSNGGSSYSHSDGGLLNLDLLNPNKNDNVLDLDLARQHLLGVGLGGGGGASQGTNSYYPNGRSSNGGNDEGLINVDLLNPNKKNNVAEVDLVKKPVVGVSLGDGGSSPSQTASSNTAPSSQGSNTGEALINVDLLNPKKENNVADVDLAKKTVIGIGVGNKNGDAVSNKP